MSTRKLNPRQRRYVEAYLRCGIAAQAARESGYSDNSVHDLLENPAINAAIIEALEDEQERMEAVRRQLVSEFERVAFYDSTALLTQDPSTLTPEQLACLEISITESPHGRTVRYKQPNRLTALNSLSRHITTLLQAWDDEEEEEE